VAGNPYPRSNGPGHLEAPQPPRVLGHILWMLGSQERGDHHSYLDDVMNESIINFADTDEEILTYQVSDQALEAAAGILEGQGKNATIAFCSGLDTCPS
jgi:hypothetical protein